MKLKFFQHVLLIMQAFEGKSLDVLSSMSIYLSDVLNVDGF